VRAHASADARIILAHGLVVAHAQRVVLARVDELLRRRRPADLHGTSEQQRGYRRRQNESPDPRARPASPLAFAAAGFGGRALGCQEKMPSVNTAMVNATPIAIITSMIFSSRSRMICPLRFDLA
jgi:hypothetical protein